MAGLAPRSLKPFAIAAILLSVGLAGCGSGPGMRAKFIEKADSICKKDDRRVKRMIDRARESLARAKSDYAKRQILSEEYDGVANVLRDEARDLKRLKPPHDAAADWFSVGVQIRNDAMTLQISSTQVSGGHLSGPPLEDPDPAVIRFLDKYGFKVCGKARAAGYRG